MCLVIASRHDQSKAGVRLEKQEKEGWQVDGRKDGGGCSGHRGSRSRPATSACGINHPPTAAAADPPSALLCPPLELTHTAQSSAPNTHSVGYLTPNIHCTILQNYCIEQCGLDLVAHIDQI